MFLRLKGAHTFLIMFTWSVRWLSSYSYEDATFFWKFGSYQHPKFTSLMDIHHNTSFRFILEDDSISLASRTHIVFV
jgi:hypothetical protein